MPLMLELKYEYFPNTWQGRIKLAELVGQPTSHLPLYLQYLWSVYEYISITGVAVQSSPLYFFFLLFFYFVFKHFHLGLSVGDSNQPTTAKAIWCSTISFFILLSLL